MNFKNARWYEWLLIILLAIILLPVEAAKWLWSKATRRDRKEKGDELDN